MLFPYFSEYMTFKVSSVRYLHIQNNIMGGVFFHHFMKLWWKSLISVTSIYKITVHLHSFHFIISKVSKVVPPKINYPTIY